MPVIVDTELKPTYIAKPNERFATTFLSTKYRDYAVNGEALMDKADGELFIKRPADGRVISFAQNKKYMYDLALELRVLLTNNEEFSYPHDSETGYYLSTNYDLVAINDEIQKNILVENSTIPNTDDSAIHKLTFSLSTGTNGFFVRPTTRDADKVICEYLTNQYNVLIENYTGNDPLYLAEVAKMNTYTKWKDSNVTIHFTVTIKKGELIKTYSTIDLIRVNEEMTILLPMNDINVDFPTGWESANVTIDELSYDKFQFMELKKDTLSESFKSGYAQFIYPDKQVLVNYLNISSFVDSADDINLLGNEFLVAALDIPYVKRYMGKMVKLQDSSEFILSTLRPSDEEWTTNTVWAERVRDVYAQGKVIRRKAAVDISAFERYISKNGGTYSGSIDDDAVIPENYPLTEVEGAGYTKSQVDRMVEKMATYVSDKTDKIIEEIPAGSTSSPSLTDDGIILEVTDVDPIQQEGE